MLVLLLDEGYHTSIWVWEEKREGRNLFYFWQPSQFLGVEFSDSFRAPRNSAKRGRWRQRRVGGGAELAINRWCQTARPRPRAFWGVLYLKTPQNIELGNLMIQGAAYNSEPLQLICLAKETQEMQLSNSLSFHSVLNKRGMDGAPTAATLRHMQWCTLEGFCSPFNWLIFSPPSFSLLSLCEGYWLRPGQGHAEKLSVLDNLLGRSSREFH